MSFFQSSLLINLCPQRLLQRLVISSDHLMAIGACCFSSSALAKRQKQQNGEAAPAKEGMLLQPPDSCKSIDVECLRKCQLEFNCGVGGVEAAIFANDLYEMYRIFATRNGWMWQTLEFDKLKFGLRFALVSVEGDWCYAKLRFESGVHRVQRLPETDKSRIHTSTASLAVLPEPEKPEAMFAPSEIRSERMRSSGAGGMNVNANSSAIRITHIPTGISVKAQDERHYYMNEKLALKRLSAILLRRQVDEANREYVGSRRLQVTSLDRTEKIRTYNFMEDRVTDHRIKRSIHGIEDFLQGGEKFEQMLELIMERHVEEEAEEEAEAVKSR